MKNVKKILLLIICCFLNVNFCYAVASISVGFNNPNLGGSDEEVSGDTDGDGMINGEKNLGNGYTCYYDYKVTYDSDIMVYGYNQDNVEIIKVKVTPEESIKAGTSIGIGIIENKSAVWSYDFGVELAGGNCDAEWTFTCYSMDYPFSKKVTAIVGTEDYNKYNSDANCIKGTTHKWVNCEDSEVTSGAYYEQCETLAESKASGLASSYINSQSYQNIKLLNPNDAMETSGAVTISTNKNCNDCSDTTTAKSGSCSCTHAYTPKSVCMNKITSDVRYGEACNTDEFQIKNDIVKNDEGNDIEHFHYFVPLNVTTGWFSLILSENAELQSADWCKDAIDANSTNYADFFVGAPAIVGGNTFPLPADNVEQAKRSVENGCFIKTEIRIPVSDGIYNVVADNKVEGYNLHVKNVSEFNPFPNPITNKDSLWFDWYEKNYSGKGNYAYNNVLPNIKSSFDELTYVAENIESKKIRNDDKLNSYLDNSLSINGMSDFITNKSIIERKKANYYEIGCGPLNSSKLSDSTNNPFHQEGCK